MRLPITEWVCVVLDELTLQRKKCALTAAAALLAFKKAQPDPDGKLSSWIGNNPCGPPEWQGIYCDVADRTTNVSHVIEM